MASIEHRGAGTPKESWRVVWRQDGVKQSEKFDSELDAINFKKRVETPNGNFWPIGYVPGLGDVTTELASVEQYFEYALRTNTTASEATIEKYRRNFRIHVYPLLGHLSLAEVDRTAVADWITKMNGKGLTHKTVSLIHATVSSMFNLAVIEGRIPRNPMHGTLSGQRKKATRDRVAQDDHEDSYLVRWEVDRLASFMDGVYADLTMFLVLTGMRWGEATALRIADVDFDTMRVRVRRAWTRGPRHEYFLDQPKTQNSKRDVAVNDDVVKMLKRICDGRDPGDFIFTTPLNGKHISHTNFYNKWDAARAKAAVCTEHYEMQRYTDRGQRLPRFPQPCSCQGVLTKRPRIHDLRHTNASWLLAGGASMYVVMRQLGHADIKMTINRYSHLMRERDFEIRDALDRGSVDVPNLVSESRDADEDQ